MSLTTVTDELGRVFKFTPIKPYVLDSLRNSTIYFSAAKSLNDPYDCQVDIRAALDRGIAATHGRRRALIAAIGATLKVPKLETDWPNMGVWSYSIELHNPLMWSHYADGHKGVCLLYEVSEDFVRRIPALVGCAPVNYGANPLTDWLVNELDETVGLDDACVATMKRTLTAKSEYWSYEREGRIIRLETGLLPVPPECLKQICFGVKVDGTQEQQIREAVSAYRGVKFARMRRDPNSDTRLIAEEC